MIINGQKKSAWGGGGLMHIKLAKKYAFIINILIAFLIPFSVYGQTEAAAVEAANVEYPYTFSISSSVGFKYGQAEEIVYKNSSSDTLLSQLLWDMKPVLYWGMELDFSQRYPMSRTGFFVNAALQAVIPARSGKMEDRDWLASGDVLSHLSVHDNYTEEGWFFDFTSGISIPLNRWLRVKAFAGLSLMNLRWLAREGYLQYASGSGAWNSFLPKVPVYGPIIYYYQNWLIFSPGVSAHFSVFSRFNIGLYFKIGPVIFCDDLDEHFERNLQFTELMYGGLMIEPKLEFILSMYERIDISLDVSYRFIKGPRGDTEVRNTQTNGVQNSKNSGGAAYYCLDTGLSVKLRF
jgi:outer membrane protease